MTMYALKLSAENTRAITTLVPTLKISKIEAQLKHSLLLNKEYYVVADFVGKNMGEVYPWVFIRSDKLAEDFDYTFPEHDNEVFEITHK